jgi:uncharacterized protein (TIGR02246 family)
VSLRRRIDELLAEWETCFLEPPPRCSLDLLIGASYKSLMLGAIAPIVKARIDGIDGCANVRAAARRLGLASSRAENTHRVHSIASHLKGVERPMSCAMASRSARPWGHLLILMSTFGLAAGSAPPETLGQTVAVGNAVAQPSAQDARADDKNAIQAAMGSFRKAFEARDAKALAEHWTAGGEYSGADGQKVRGREALTKGFQAFFTRTPELNSTLQHKEIRFLSNDTAIDEGSVTVKRGPLEAATSANFTALFVREDGRWRLAQLSESTPDGDSISDLAWLVGDWSSQEKDGAEIRTTYSWHANKKFIIGEFTIKEKDRTLSGTHVIGIEPKSGVLHSWTFEASGGVGEAGWSRDGDHWVLDSSGTMPDGSVLTQTNILRRINDRTFTWQSVNRSLGDRGIDDLAPVKVTRAGASK